MYDKKQLVKIVSAVTISDGHLSKPRGTGGNSNLQLTQVECHKDLLDVVASYLSQLTKVSYTERILEKETHRDQIK